MVFQGGPQQLVNLFEKLHVHLLPSIFSQLSLAMHSNVQQAINTELYIFIHMSTSHELINWPVRKLTVRKTQQEGYQVCKAADFVYALYRLCKLALQYEACD